MILGRIWECEILQGIAFVEGSGLLHKFIILEVS